MIRRKKNENKEFKSNVSEEKKKTKRINFKTTRTPFILISNAFLKLEIEINFFS